MIIDKEYSRELAESLLKIDAVVLRPSEPFTWASGWNSPIYCDNRLTLRFPEIRTNITNAFEKFLTQNYNNVNVITGTATAGIPHATLVAQRLNKPLAYVRAKAKAYGLGNQIEGGVDKGQSTVVIEDLISTGGSVMSVVDALQFVGAEVEAILSIFTYGFDKSIKRFKEKNIPVYTLTDYTTLIDVALEIGKIKKADIDLLNNWRKSPDTWPK